MVDLCRRHWLLDEIGETHLNFDLKGLEEL